MRRLRESLNSTAYRQSSVTFLLFFASWGIWWSFFQIWLTDKDSGLGLDGAKTGTVYSINSIGTLIIMLFYGAMQDKLVLKRHVAVVAAIFMSCVGPFVNFIYEPLLKHHFMFGVILGAIMLSGGFIAGVGLFEALSERLSRAYGFEYGQARMWGSFGYAIVALLAGFLFTINPALNFWLGSVFGLALLALLLFWKAPALPAEHSANVDPDAKAPSVRDMVGLLKLPSLWVVIGFVLLSWTFYTVFDQQMFPDFYTGLFSSHSRGQQMYGVLNSVQVFLEAIMMGVVPIIMDRIGVKRTLMLGVTVMFLRISGCAILHDPIAVSFVKMFHAAEVPLCILSIFRYFTLHFNPKLSASLYMVGFNIAAQLGSIVLSPLLGNLRDSVGYQHTFYVIAAIVLVAGIYGRIFLHADNVHVEGEPFVTKRQREQAESVSA